LTFRGLRARTARATRTASVTISRMDDEALMASSAVLELRLPRRHGKTYPSRPMEGEDMW
jgi:hypothetical protein